jgi:pimeloyl-ACP methyl ester carboxylesterase
LRRILGVAVLVAAFALAGCTDSTPSTAPSPLPSASTSAHEPNQLKPFYAQHADWTPCDTFECASISVPLDYSRPGGKTVTIALLRREADNPDQKLGSLFVNPGGPGVSGIDYARQADSLFTQPVLDHYDIIGWDPRGVGDSTSITCLTPEQTDTLYATDGTPDDPAEVHDIVRIFDGFTKGCESDAPQLIPHLGTFNSARDMDILRAAVGEPRMNYFGASYGTELGAVYADLFPKEVGRMVLDGALDPSVGSKALSLGQLRGFQRATDSFIEDCINRDGCAVGPTLQDAENQLSQLLSDIDAKPLPTQSGRDLTESLATTGMLAAMYSQASGWPSLRLGLSQAFNGDGTVLLALADAYAERNPDGSYASNVNSAFPAISCTDRPDSASIAQIRRVIPTYEKISPVFGRSFAWAGLSCRNWPVKHGDLPATVKAKGSNPIVVIGTTRDPATPYAWAVRMARSLDHGVLISRNGDGHTGYNSGNDCVDQAVDDYLIAGDVPANPTRC